MTTLVNTAVTAMVAALQSAPAVCAVVDRVRLRALAADIDVALAVRPIASEVMQAGLSPAAPISWQTTIAVECYARSNASTAPDVAVDAVLQGAFARLMEDPTLGGLVVSIKPRAVSYDFDADGTQSTCATLVLEVLQRTAGNTLT